METETCFYFHKFSNHGLINPNSAFGQNVASWLHLRAKFGLMAVLLGVYNFFYLTCLPGLGFYVPNCCLLAPIPPDGNFIWPLGLAIWHGRASWQYHIPLHLIWRWYQIVYLFYPASRLHLTAIFILFCLTVIFEFFSSHADDCFFSFRHTAVPLRQYRQEFGLMAAPLQQCWRRHSLSSAALSGYLVKRSGTHSPIYTLYLTLRGTPLELVYQFGYPHSGLLFCCVAISEATCPFILYYSRYTGTRQFKHATSSLSSQAITARSVQYLGKLPGPHSLSLSSWPTCTWHQIIEFYSTLWCCLGREGLLWNNNFMGCKLCAYTNMVTPTMQILHLVSIRRCHVPSIFWFGDHGSCQYLVLPQGYANYTSLVYCVEGHPQTCLPLQESLTVHCVVMTTHGCLQRHASVFSYLLLLRSICHDPSFMSHDPLSFFEPAMTHPSHWPILSCLNWFTLANVSST